MVGALLSLKIITVCYLYELLQCSLLMYIWGTVNGEYETARWQDFHVFFGSETFLALQKKLRLWDGEISWNLTKSLWGAYFWKDHLPPLMEKGSKIHFKLMVSAIVNDSSPLHVPDSCSFSFVFPRSWVQAWPSQWQDSSTTSHEWNTLLRHVTL